MCVCVCEREREREREVLYGRFQKSSTYLLLLKRILKIKQPTVNNTPAAANKMVMITSGRGTVSTTTLGTPSYGINLSV